MVKTGRFGDNFYPQIFASYPKCFWNAMDECARLPRRHSRRLWFAQVQRCFHVLGRLASMRDHLPPWAREWAFVNGERDTDFRGEHHYVSVGVPIEGLISRLVAMHPEERSQILRRLEPFALWDQFSRRVADSIRDPVPEKDKRELWDALRSATLGDRVAVARVARRIRSIKRKYRIEASAAVLATRTA